jgi:DNA-binding response OmpR family regulator
MPTEERTVGERPCVLVVDNEPGLADLYVVWLAETCETRVAYSGQTALDALDHDVDVVLHNRQLPDVSGVELAAEIRARSSDCSLCVVTACQADVGLVDIDADDYLHKPVSQAQLQDAVDRLYARTRFSAPLRELLASLSKLVAIEATQPSSVLDGSDAYRRIQRRVDDRLDELRTDDPAIDWTTVVTTVREPSEGTTAAETLVRLRDRFDPSGRSA